MVTRYLRNLILIAFLLCLVFNRSYAEQSQKNLGLMGETAVEGRIIEINVEHRFVVINLGSADGIKKGMLLSVLQKGGEAAKIKVKRVRRHISACDIQLVYLERAIGIGDIVAYKKELPFVETLKPFDRTRTIELEPIVVDIDAPKRTIFAKTLTIFEEFGVVVTGTDVEAYIIKAHKDVEMPLGVGIMTEWGPPVRDRRYYTAEIISTPKYNRLVLYLRGVYIKAGQLYDHDISKTSGMYKEIQTMLFRIKDSAEKL